MEYLLPVRCTKIEQSLFVHRFVLSHSTHRVEQFDCDRKCTSHCLDQVVVEDEIHYRSSNTKVVVLQIVELQPQDSEVVLVANVQVHHYLDMVYIYVCV